MNSIRTRLTRDLLVISLALVTLSCTGLFFIARSMLIEEFDHALKAQAFAVGALLEREESGALSLEAPEKLPAQFRGPKIRAYYRVINPDGSSTLQSEAFGNGAPSLLPPSASQARYWNLSLPDRHEGRAIVMPFDPRQASPSAPLTPERWVRIVVAADRGELDDTLEAFVLICSLGALLLTGGTLLVVPRVLRKGLQPLAELAEDSATIGAESLSRRFRTETMPVELQPVSARLNELLARLEEAFERERRVSADLAHELRTPVAELRVLAETALKWPAQRDKATDSDNLAIALHLEAIITQMLSLARSEHGRITPVAVDVDLEVLVGEAWKPCRQRATARRLGFTPRLGETHLKTDPLLLGSILSNLLDNAADYASEGGEIGVTSALTTEGAACITVSNTTDGLSAADVKHLFERFWRKEESRSAEGHLGLGLSLVRAYCQALGWTVTASLEPEGVLSIRLTEKVGRQALP